MPRAEPLLPPALLSNVMESPSQPTGYHVRGGMLGLPHIVHLHGLTSLSPHQKDAMAC